MQLKLLRRIFKIANARNATIYVTGPSAKDYLDEKKFLEIFDLTNSINSKKSFGGTSFDNIKKMIMKYKKEK